MKPTPLVILALFIPGIVAALPPSPHPQAQGGDKPSQPLIGRQSDGSVLVPTNQALLSAGTEITFTGRPTDLALSPNSKWLAVLNSKSLTLIDLAERKVTQEIPIKGGHPFAGICWNGDRIYAPQVAGLLQSFEVDGHGRAAAGPAIRLPGYAGGMCSPEATTLYIVLNRDNTLAALNLKTFGAAPALRQVAVGVAPYAVVADKTGRKLYVSNWGGRRAGSEDVTSPSARTDTVVDPATGVACSGTVSVIDAAGFQVIKHIDVGLHPCAMVMHPSAPKLFVANANSDTVSVIDTRTDAVVQTIAVKPDARLPFGSAPNALAISPDGSRLYVANGGNNCIAVFDLREPAAHLIGLIPTGWYPGALQLLPDGRTLLVANVKGQGSLGGTAKQTREGHHVKSFLGSVSIIPVPGDEQLKGLTQQVYANNRWAEALDPTQAPPLPPLKHVFYIIKENRTYDQILGDLGRGNGDPQLCQFGRDVTPNQHALAEQFVTLDNFYCSGVLSADGHQWTNEAYVTDYLEKSFGGFARSYPYNGTDPLAYASSGFLWDNALRHQKTFRNYGEFGVAVLQPANATWLDCYNDWKNGTQHVTFSNHVGVAPLRRWICPNYPGFNMRVPDQVRADIFLKEFRGFEKSGQLPNLIMMLLPANHTNGTSPGTPTPRAYVADNDLAVGRIVEAISKSRFWKDTAIFIVEDDAQNGTDHVDGHRTVAFCISPYTRRGVVDSTLYNQTSMVRTIEMILGLPPMNQFDLTATPMYGCFTDRPNLAAYSAIPNRIPLDELNPPLEALRGKALLMARQSLEQNFTLLDAADEKVLNRIIWASTKGYDVPYPGRDEDDDD